MKCSSDPFLGGGEKCSVDSCGPCTKFLPLGSGPTYCPSSSLKQDVDAHRYRRPVTYRSPRVCIPCSSAPSAGPCSTQAWPRVMAPRRITGRRSVFGSGFLSLPRPSPCRLLQFLLGKKTQSNFSGHSAMPEASILLHPFIFTDEDPLLQAGLGAE